jgi:hypothetical protein
MTNTIGFITLESHAAIANKIREVVEHLDRAPAEDPSTRYWSLREACWASYYSYCTWPDHDRPVAGPEEIIARVADALRVWTGPDEQRFRARARASHLLARHRLHRSRWQVSELLGAGGVHDELANVFSCGSGEREDAANADALDEGTPEWREWTMERANLARYSGNDAEATRLYRDVFRKALWRTDLPSGHAPGEDYRITLIAHNRASQVCNWLTLVVPTSSFRDDVASWARKSAGAAIKLLELDPDAHLSVTTPRFRGFAANHSKHLSFFYDILGEQELAKRHRDRAFEFFSDMAPAGSKGDELREQYEAFGAIARGDSKSIEVGVDILCRQVARRGAYDYSPKVVYESFATLLRIVALDLLRGFEVPSPPWGDEIPRHRLVHARYAAMVSNCNPGAVDQ